MRFKCPNDNYKHYVDDKTKKKIYLNFWRKQKSDKIGEYFLFPNIKDQSLVESTEIVQVLKDVQNLRRERYQFPLLNIYSN